MSLPKWARKTFAVLVAFGVVVDLGIVWYVSGGANVRAQSRMTISQEYPVSVGECDGGASWAVGLNSNALLVPVASCVPLTNISTAELSYLDSEIDSAWIDFVLPSDWLTGSTVSLKLKWRTSATTGNAVWQIATLCRSDAQTYDATMNTAQTIVDATKGTTLQINDASLASMTMTNCAPEETLTVRVFRDPAHASDTIAATAMLRSLVLKLRRSVSLE